MKVVWKIVLIVALALVILGVAAIAVSLFSGGSLEGVRNNVPSRILNRASPTSRPPPCASRSRPES